MMELVEITESYELEELPIPAEYIFRLESGEEWALCFIPTVPYDGASDSEEIFGDLFACRAIEIISGTRPIVRGGSLERQTLDRLGTWVDAQILEPGDEADWFGELSWFRQALERRRIRVETDQ